MDFPNEIWLHKKRSSIGDGYRMSLIYSIHIHFSHYIDFLQIIGRDFFIRYSSYALTLFQSKCFVSWLLINFMFMFNKYYLHILDIKSGVYSGQLRYNYNQNWCLHFSYLRHLRVYACANCFNIYYLIVIIWIPDIQTFRGNDGERRKLSALNSKDCMVFVFLEGIWMKKK